MASKEVKKIEEETAIEIYEEMDKLTVLSKDLEHIRQQVALEARRKDIDYVRKMDVVIDTILTTLTENKQKLSEAIVDMLDKGNMKALKELMVAFAVTVDKREAILGFDETRHARKRRMNLRVMFKGPDGTQAGVSIEQD